MVSERVSKFLRLEQISAKQFATEIGVQNSTVSHILSGRNKPSFDFIEKILRRYPQIDPEWLILGRNQMLKQEIEKTNKLLTPQNPVNETLPHEPDLFSNIQQPNNSKLEQNPIDEKSFSKEVYLEKVLFFYSDGTFKQFSPNK